MVGWRKAEKRGVIYKKEYKKRLRLGSITNCSFIKLQVNVVDEREQNAIRFIAPVS